MTKIGNVEIEGKIILAPMAGVTSLSYRNFMKKFGYGLGVTEMISDCGLIYGNLRTEDYLKTSELERPVSIQLFGNNAETLQKAIKIVENHTQNYDFLDINLGCTVRKITSDGAGSALTKDVAKLEEIMTKIVACSSKPVTAKIRLGWDDKTINVFEVVKALEKAGVSMIGIHARTSKQMYDGKPDFEAIKNIRKSMSVPLAISGNIYTRS